MSDLDRMKRLAGILTEGIMAVPPVGGNESDMQTAGAAARGANASSFDAAQPQVDEAKFSSVSCSQCGRMFGPGNSGYSHCEDHVGQGPIDEEENMSSANFETLKARFSDLMSSFVEPQEAFDIIGREMDEMGIDADEYDSIMNSLEQEFFPDSEDTGADDMSADADALTSAGWGSDEDYGSAEDMFEGNPPIDKRTMGKLNKQVNDKKWANHKADDEKNAKDAADAKKQPTPVEEDLNNGYADLKFMDANDFFPDGADSPVTSRAGPSGARHGDNPEQKKMEVAEAHKELVYNYRKFIKESARK